MSPDSPRRLALQFVLRVSLAGSATAHLHHWGLGFGYRVLDYDFEQGSDELDLAFEGLLFGLEFRF